MTTSKTDPTRDSPTSRRALLAGAIGGIGAVAAGAIGRVNPVRAEGEAIVVGGEYFTATTPTGISNVANTSPTFYVSNTAGGRALEAYGTTSRAVSGYSDSDAGVYGTSASGGGVSGVSDSGPGLSGESDSSFGIIALSTSNTGAMATSLAHDKAASIGYSAANGTGVHGHSGSSGLSTPKARTGVYGYAVEGTASRGVWGQATKGQGVRGQATSGAALYGQATSGFALRTSGRIKAAKVSGVATIAAGSTGVTIDPGVNVTSTSFVLLTPMANIGSRGLWFTTNVSANTFRIRISTTRGSATKVAWLLLG